VAKGASTFASPSLFRAGWLFAWGFGCQAREKSRSLADQDLFQIKLIPPPDGIDPGNQVSSGNGDSNAI